MFKYAANEGTVLGFILNKENINRMKNNDPAIARLAEQEFHIDGRPNASVLFVYNENKDGKPSQRVEALTKLVQLQKDIVLVIEVDDGLIDFFKTRKEPLASRNNLGGKDIEIQFGIVETDADAVALFKDRIGSKTIIKNENNTPGFAYNNN